MKIISIDKSILALTSSISFILWLSTLSILFSLFFIGGPSYYSSPVYKEFWNIGHIIFFALSTYQLILLVRKKTFIFITLISFNYCFIIGSSIELIQSKIGRSMSLYDLYRDALGTLLALSLFFYLCIEKKNTKNNYYLYLLFLSFALIAIDQKHLVQAVQVHLQAQSNFPVLADFENNNELTQWEGNNLSLSNKYVLTGLFSMKANLSAQTKYSGLTFKDMPNNWSGFDYLLINIYNPNKDDLEMCTKITDLEHDLNNQSYNNRFNQCFTLLGSQWNNIKISLIEIEASPTERKLDLSNISQLGIFTSGLKNDKIIYLDGMTLL